MISTLKNRETYIAGHQLRVADLACFIASEMGIPKELIGGIYMAGIVHDIGKIRIPFDILNKSEPLTKIEFTMIKTHSRVGYDILKTLEFKWPVAKIVHQHHENIDGSGYPSGISGEEILIEARILCVADVVESMTYQRPYRPALGVDRALEEIYRNKGILYDSNVVDACLRSFADKGYNFR
jgi:putative nucleotidyltransferase with HDIG domain